MLFADSTVSELTRTVDDAFFWIGGVCVFLLAAITVVMVTFVVKYGRKRNPEAAQIEGNLPLEITWTVIPLLIVLWMFFKGYEGFKLMRDVPADAMDIQVVARSWFWTFVYPEQGVSSDRLFVPVGRSIKLNLTADKNDVVHSFYLPAFRVKEDCVPGRTNYLWFKPEREGTYNVFCAEYCGKDHSKMITVMEVLSPQAFQAWLERKVADKNKPVELAQAMDPNAKEIVERDGAKLYATYCVSCHGQGGQGGLVAGARDFRSLANWKRSPKLVDVYRTISEGIDGTQMRAFSNLPPWDRFALMHQVASFYKGSDRPPSSAKDLAKLKKDYHLGETPPARRRISIEQAMRAVAGKTGGDGRDD